MKVNIIQGYGLNDVRQLDMVMGTAKLPILNNATNTFDENCINILVCDYTPIQSGRILIKRLGDIWEPLRMNNKIVTAILSNIPFITPHCFRNQNILASIYRSGIKSIELDL